MFWKKTLAKRLSKWLREGGSLQESLGAVVEVETAEDARLVCAVLDKAQAESGESSDAQYNLHAAIAFFQKVSDQRAMQVLVDQGLPRLRALVRRYLEKPHVDADLIIFVLKQLATYGVADDARLVVDMARDPEGSKQWLWEVVFRESSKHGEFSRLLTDGLRDPLPGGFCRVAYLDFVSRQLLERKISKHPFDTPTGQQAIREWLEATKPEDFSYAVSAAASLPFLSAGSREPLFALAEAHVDPLVRMEAAWARAKLGEEAGFEQLVQYARDPRTAARALNYLTELGEAHRIPANSSKPDFQALAGMSEWLAHPNEFGRMPDHIEIAIHRELYWPPTSDRRSLWVIRYGYRDDDGSIDSGFGLFGSTTWAMMDDETRDGMIEPLDVFAVHCCWELEMNEDSRAPKERNVAAGRKLLAEHNPEFRLQSA